MINIFLKRSTKILAATSLSVVLFSSGLLAADYADGGMAGAYTAPAHGAKRDKTKSKVKKTRLTHGPVSGFPDYTPAMASLFVRTKAQIDNVFQRHGFRSFESRLVEKASTLESKGIDGKEVYALARLRNGGVEEGEKEERLALRFDLTVPLARYVAEHNDKIVFPFSRSQIQKVYRGEHAVESKGRLREFYQCDVDTIGCQALDVSYDAKAMLVFNQVFQEVFNLKTSDFKFRVGNRKILQGLFEHFGIHDEKIYKKVLAVVDDVEKVDKDTTAAHLAEYRLTVSQAEAMFKFFSVSRLKPLDALQALASLPITSALYIEGVKELEIVVNTLLEGDVKEESLAVDPSIARGLDYYTGTVFETRLTSNAKIGSICSGGRYDNLTGDLAGRNKKFPGVGGSIGLDRLLPSLVEFGFLDDRPTMTDVYVSSGTIRDSEGLASKLRGKNFNVETAPAGQRFEKTLKFAKNSGIPLMVTQHGISNWVIENMFLGKEEGNQVTIPMSNEGELLSRIEAERLRSEEVYSRRLEERKALSQAQPLAADEVNAADLSSLPADQVGQFVAAIKRSFVEAAHSEFVDRHTACSDIPDISFTSIQGDIASPQLLEGNFDVLVLWYASANGFHDCVLEHYRPVISEAIARGKRVYLLDMAAWAGFFGAKHGLHKETAVLKNALAGQKVGRVKLLSTADFFEEMIAMQGAELDVFKSILSNPGFLAVSASHKATGINAYEVLGREDLGLTQTDTGKCYSAFQAAELPFIVKRIASELSGLQQTGLSIRFLLPVSELAYYNIDGGTSLSEHIRALVMGTPTRAISCVSTEIVGYQYGDSARSRPYNDGHRVSELTFDQIAEESTAL